MVRTTNGWRHRTQVLRFRRAVVSEAIEPRHQIAVLPRGRTRRQCFVVGIGRLEPCSHAGGGFRSSGERGLRRSAHPRVHRLTQEGVSAKSAAHLDIRRPFGWRSPFFAGCTPRKGDSNSKRSFHVRPRRIPSIGLANKGHQRDSKQSRTQANKFSPARMLLFGPEQCPKLVPNSAKASSSGTEGSNLSRSAMESFSVRNSATDDRNTRHCGRFRRARGSGERPQPRIPQFCGSSYLQKSNSGSRRNAPDHPTQMIEQARPWTDRKPRVHA